MIMPWFLGVASRYYDKYSKHIISFFLFGFQMDPKVRINGATISPNYQKKKIIKTIVFVCVPVRVKMNSPRVLRRFDFIYWLIKRHKSWKKKILRNPSAILGFYGSNCCEWNATFSPNSCQKHMNSRGKN